MARRILSCRGNGSPGQPQTPKNEPDDQPTSAIYQIPYRPVSGPPRESSQTSPPANSAGIKRERSGNPGPLPGINVSKARTGPVPTTNWTAVLHPVTATQMTAHARASMAGEALSLHTFCPKTTGSRISDRNWYNPS
ncbi:hypothetical protein NW754_16794 [Fusarium falciforme]|nr:hypothetical protein NW754_16794 [Fusarium falciforme]